MNREEICKIIDDKLDSKIKDFKNINPPYRKVEVILKNYKNFQKMLDSLKNQLKNINIIIRFLSLESDL